MLTSYDGQPSPSLVLQHGVALLDTLYPQALFPKALLLLLATSETFKSQPSSTSIMTQIETGICWAIPTLQNETDGQLGSQYGSRDGPVKNTKVTRVASYNVDTILSMTQPIALICLPFILTYLFTLVQSIYAQRSKKVGKKAPVVPYAVPIVGHAVMFVWSLNTLIKKNT